MTTIRMDLVAGRQDRDRKGLAGLRPQLPLLAVLVMKDCRDHPSDSRVVVYDYEAVRGSCSVGGLAETTD